MDTFNSQNTNALKAKKKRWKPKGRQVEQEVLDKINILFENITIKRDELIEYLHLLQDNYGVLFDKHLVALSEITRLPLAEIYGMSECSGPSTMSLPKKYYKPGTVGKVLPGTDVQLAEDGEILISGPHVFQGYYRNEKASKACLNQDNYLCSGDLGSFSTDGYLKVTGRKRNIIITAGGENIPTDSLQKKYKKEYFWWAVGNIPQTHRVVYVKLRKVLVASEGQLLLELAP